MKRKTPVVLVIEDDSWFAEQHKRVLTEAGFRVQQAGDGLAGIEAIDAFRPDAIVLDIFLPGPNALVLLHETQSYTDLSWLPVVICSSGAVDIPPGKLDAYGVKSVLDKGTMHPSDLVAAVKRVLL